MGMKMRVLLECAMCELSVETWMKLYEDQPGTSKAVRDLEWKLTHEKGLVCPACFGLNSGKLSLVPRGL